jgi:hypothetical protein
MFNIDGNYITATRGDAVFFGVTAEDNGMAYVFKEGDVLRLKIFKKKDAGAVYLTKDFYVTKTTNKAEIYLTGDEMKFGEVISKPTDYWYEICLNPDTNPQTIIGYSEEGAAVIRLLPEGADE